MTTVSAADWLSTPPNVTVNATRLIAIVHSAWFSTLFSLLAALAIAAIFLNALVTICNFLLVGQHVNSRILFGNMSLASMMIGICEILRVINVYSCGPNGEGQFISDCTQRSFYVAGTEALQWSFYTMSLERVIATIRHASYSMESCALGILLIPACWLQSTVRLIMFFAPGPHSETVVVSSSNSTESILLCPQALTQTPLKTIVNSGVDMLAGILAIASYAITLKLARQKHFDFVSNQAHLSLNSRLQLRHSTELTEMLMPSVIAHAIVWLVVQLLAILMACVQLDIDVNLRLALATLIMDFLVMSYIVVNPLVAFYRGEPLRRKCAQLFGRKRRRIGPITAQQTMLMQQHFEMLKNVWSTQYSRKDRYKVPNETRSAILCGKAENGTEVGRPGVYGPRGRYVAWPTSPMVGTPATLETQC